ncbi:MAG TPA: Crp/Fnr family transcriptional regulator [Candidatus Angelobacter sp.]|nr:Crp/Fnr family transcriptional regulator [Candidatus Angelobacter sp.]
MNEGSKTDNLKLPLTGLPEVKGLSARQMDPVACLREPGTGSTIHRLRKKDALFYQAMPADCVFYVLKGRVKLTTVSTEGKEATIALMRAGDFLGEECVAEGRPLRTTTAIAISECTVLRIERRGMIEVLRRNPQFFNFFLSFIVLRNVRMQEDLVDRLFHTSEKRLARVLLALAGLNDGGPAEVMVPKVSQETLAEIVGTTRSRVSFFMNGFRKQGFIDYDGDYSGNILIRSSLRGVISKRK